MADGRRLPTGGLVTRAKDGRAFVFCERCYQSVQVGRMHGCIPDDAKIETEAKEKPIEKKKSKLKLPPPTAFYIFMNGFREIYRYENRFINLKDVPKFGGEKWKSFTEEEKKVYRDKAAELLEKYNKSLECSDADDDDEEEDEEEETYDAEEKQADEVENKKRCTQWWSNR
ncbi:unnamed protein product [Eruca vesicaria subsp. sativa]|uniref:HMG box domain-containing protein n=1 Tax=Eruca vesicaria subsp. sativa TaxID=29727 RepID=A0ABC8L6R7_ERUVS|nr:unnamed protein product [Eruca vesicaria subsp. sativa]